jgi:hypothetical protein
VLAKQKLAVYLKKSVRWDNMSVKKIKHFVCLTPALSKGEDFLNPLSFGEGWGEAK